MTEQNLALELKENKSFMYDNHAGHISTNLHRFYEKGLFLDVILKAGIGDLEMGAHRIVLCAASEIFLETCCRNDNAHGKVEIQLKDVQGTSLRLIVDSLYTGSIQLNIDSFDGVLIAAKILKMDDIAKVCYDFIGELLDSNNCLRVLLYAEQQSFTMLHEVARTFVLKHFEQVHTSMEFLQLTESQLKRLLSSDNVSDVSQELLVQTLMTWVGHDSENREKLTCSLLTFVNFKLLDPKFIFKNIKSVCKSNECHELIRSWLKWHESQESRSVQKLYFIVRTIDPRNYIKIQVYNHQMNKWSKEKWPKPALNRGSFGITVINKKVIIAGGEYRRRATNSVEYLDLETNQWTDLPTMILARVNPDLIELNGDLYVISQRNEEGYPRPIEKFNFISCKWEERCPLPESLNSWYVQFVALNGLLYAYSTYSIQCYDPFSNEWTQKAIMNEQRIECHVAAVNGYLYAVGGNTIERYDPLNNSWSFVKPFNQERFSGLCTALNNRLIICGRFSGMYYSNLIVAEYDPESNEWKNLDPLKSNMYSSKYLFPVCN